MDARCYWLGFNLVKGIGAVRLQNLIQRFGSVENAWEAEAPELVRAGLSPRIVERLLQVRQGTDLERLWERIQSQGIQMLTWEDESYPSRLREIEQSPPVLYVRGELLAEDSWAVAVVGTRRVTPYGRQVSEEVAAVLAANGVTVVSGLARGVDAIAHTAALKAGGRTLAVLGCGVDRVYPSEHRALAEQVMAHGALISDYAPGTPPESANFPPRNRIIAGLSVATIVVEAGETSGALITAEFAAEQGREVFAVPGSILAPQSKGTNRLIANGARPLLDARDVLDVLNLTRVDQQRAARKVLPVDATEAQIAMVMSEEPLHVDEIRARCGLPIEKVTAALILMELKGIVRQVGGLHYVTVREEQTDYLAG
ncbi:MAG: DNA-processing protein DprA [Candidatus Villigracilaceae bacterium]